MVALSLRGAAATPPSTDRPAPADALSASQVQPIRPAVPVALQWAVSDKSDGTPERAPSPSVRETANRAEALKPQERLELLEKRFAKLEKKLGKAVEKDGLGGFWDDGFRWETADRDFRFHVGGRLENDWAFFAAASAVEDRFGELDDATEFRRARLATSGRIYDAVRFAATYDFAGRDAGFRNVYIGLDDLPVVDHFQVGNFKEPFGLEWLTSGSRTTFMERALTTTLNPDRNSGFMVYDDALEERLTWAVGLFRDTDAFGFGQGDDGVAATGRISLLPYYRDDGRRLLHLGLSYSHRLYLENELRLRERPEANLAPRFLNTGDFAAQDANLPGAEIALVCGPLSLQAEYIHAFVDALRQDNPDFFALYVQASYVLTGEHRSYKRSDGVFDAVTPANNFAKGKGCGAWELAARYSRADLDDQDIRGGTLSDFTAGLNWYLNRHSRVMWNYVLAHLHGVGDTQIAQMRFQVDF